MIQKESSTLTEIKFKDPLLSHWILKLLAASFIPLLSWGVYLQVNVLSLKDEIKNYERLEGEIDRLDTLSRSNETSLATIKEKFLNVQQRINDIKRDINSLTSGND